jgi:hypothetical protein
MKTQFITITLLMLATILTSTSMAAETDGAAKKQINQAIKSKDIIQVMSILPVIEKLWPQHPKDYFESIKSAAGVLSIVTNADTQAVITNLFTDIIVKTLPTGAGPAALCLDEKNDAILYFLNFKEVRDNKTEWVSIAKYIGQIRDQVDPHFVPKMIYRNPPGLMNASPEKARQIIQENENNKAFNRLQQSLRNVNIILTFQLLHNCSRFPASSPENKDFIQHISSAAHLTEAEQKQLQ